MGDPDVCDHCHIRLRDPCDHGKFTRLAHSKLQNTHFIFFCDLGHGNRNSYLTVAVARSLVYMKPRGECRRDHFPRCGLSDAPCDTDNGQCQTFSEVTAYGLKCLFRVIHSDPGTGGLRHFFRFFLMLACKHRTGSFFGNLFQKFMCIYFLADDRHEKISGLNLSGIQADLV